MSGALYFAEHHTAQQLLVTAVIRLYQTGSVETLVPTLSYSVLTLELLQSTKLATVMPAEDGGGDGSQVRMDPTLGGVKYTSHYLFPLRLPSAAGGTLHLAEGT